MVVHARRGGGGVCAQQQHALDSQRPFVYESVTLREVTQPAPLKEEDPEGIAAFLEAKVRGVGQGGGREGRKGGTEEEPEGIAAFLEGKVREGRGRAGREVT